MVEAGEWREYREIRLEALREAPDAFWETHAEAVQLDDEAWRRRASKNADTSSLFAAIDESENWVGLAASALYDSDPSIAGIFSVYVTPEHRGGGAGVARMLMEAAVEWARSTPATSLRLHVNEVNEHALAFYHRLGFTETGKVEPFRDDPSVKLVEMGYDAFR